MKYEIKQDKQGIGIDHYSVRERGGEVVVPGLVERRARQICTAEKLAEPPRDTNPEAWLVWVKAKSGVQISTAEYEMLKPYVSEETSK